MTLFKGRSQDDISLFFTAFLKSCSYLRSQAQQLQKKWKEKSGLVWKLWRAAKKNCFLRSYAVNLIINCFKKSFLRSWELVQNIEAFICVIFLVVFIFKKPNKTFQCQNFALVVYTIHFAISLSFSSREKERELKTLLCWRALEPRLERYETEIKFRHKMCFTFSWRAKIWIYGMKFMGCWELRKMEYG